MLTILPEQNPQLLASYEPQGEETTLLVSKNAGEEIGHIAVERRGDCLYIIGFKINGFDFTNAPDYVQYIDIDAILRAAGSFALNRNLYLVCCEKEEYFPILKRFGFEETDNYLSITLKQLLKTCKNC